MSAADEDHEATEDDDGGDDDDDDDDEDEEMLRLKLQAIEAKLKLKKLQNKKKQQIAFDAPSPSTSTFSSPRKTVKGPSLPSSSSSSLFPGVQVPISPIKDRMPPFGATQPNTSPARVLLGIDKGLRAKDVSLKPPRTLARSSAVADSKPKSTFSERLAASRLSNEDREAKERRIRQARTGTFARPSSTASPSITDPSATAATPQSPFITSDSLKGTTPATALPPSDRYSVIDGDSEGKSTDPSEDGSSFESFSALHLSKRNIPHIDLVRHLDAKELYTLPRLLKEVAAPHYDPPDCESDFVVLAIIASKSSPYNTKPTHQLKSSSEPDLHDEINPRNKFIVMTLTDLKWEVDLFLFDSAFTQFWKLTPGTLVAILNPAIMPPKTNQHNGRFSLKLASSEDTVLEIGNARDLGFCKSLKKDGKECTAWVNKRKTHFCDYHVELAVEKTRKNRMEVNGMYRPMGHTGAGSKPHVNSRKLGDGQFGKKTSGLNRDYESHSQYFMGGKGGLSAASLLDAEDLGKADAMRKRLADREKERILGEKLGRLGNGIGAEYLRAPHVSSSSSSTAAGPSRRAVQSDKPDPASLGLLGKKAADVDLRPIKGRNKRPFAPSTTASSSSITGTGTEAVGWSGANKRGILLPPRAPSPEKGQTGLRGFGRDLHNTDSSHARAERPESPRKRARFDLAGKGLREPGRESLGDAAAAASSSGSQVKRDVRGRIIIDHADSSDDDLDII